MESVHHIRRSESQKFLERIGKDFLSPSTSQNFDLEPRCSRCIVNSSYTLLNEYTGLCPECEEHSRVFGDANSITSRNRSAQEEIALQEQRVSIDDRILSACGSGKKGYDALLLYSGGKDSAYLLNELTSRFPSLRILALMIDNGFASDVAIRNVEFAFRKISITRLIFSPEKNLYSTLFRHCLLNFGTRGGYETVDRSDGDLLFDIAKNIAAREEIPLILAGLSRAQCEDILQLKSFLYPKERDRERRTEIAGFQLSDIFEQPDYRYFWDGSSQDESSIPEVIFPFFAWEYDEAAVRESVVRAGLIPEGDTDPIVTNHQLIPVILALDYLRLGYCTFEPEFAKLVRRGDSPREMWLPFFQALEVLVPRGEFMPESIGRVLRELGLTPEELEIPTSS